MKELESLNEYFRMVEFRYADMVFVFGCRIPVAKNPSFHILIPH